MNRGHVPIRRFGRIPHPDPPQGLEHHPTPLSIAVRPLPGKPARTAITPFLVRYGGFALAYRANRLSGRSLAKNGHSFTDAEAGGWDRWRDHCGAWEKDHPSPKPSLDQMNAMMEEMKKQGFDGGMAIVREIPDEIRDAAESASAESPD